jgi:predicted flap endonuclease-1-like 5' DNA nuclease
MKRGWIILVLLLLLIASVIILLYLWTQGVVMDLPMTLAVLILIVLIIIIVGLIVWLAFWTPQKKTVEPEPQRAVVENLKAEPSSRRAKETVDRGAKIIDVEGIGPVYAEKLNSVGIYTTIDLLEAGATPLGRKELAEKTGISADRILEWVNMADLFRIKGVGEEYSDLLEESDVDTVVELAKRVPENLHAKMLEVNAKKRLVHRAPTLNEVRQWIEEAKTLPRKVEY